MSLDFTLEREYAAPRDRVWAHLTDPALMATWFCPNPALPTSCTLDVRPAGDWSCRMGDYVIRGHYVALDPPTSMTFTWGWAHAPEEPSTTVAIALAPLPGGTRLVLTHAEVEPDARDDGHQGGWVRTLTRLDEALAHGASSTA
jgi:uncharacterized protein YndB with AHSA1/START domain